LVVVVVFPLVFGSEREVFLFRLGFCVLGSGLSGRRRWEKKTKIVVFVLVFLRFRFWGRRWWWENL
jgi:hypothetical protein